MAMSANQTALLRPYSKAPSQEPEEEEGNIKEWTGLSFTESQFTAKDRMQWANCYEKVIGAQQPSTG